MPENLDNTIYRIADGRVEIDPVEHIVTVDGTPNKELHGIRFNILSNLASQPDRIATNEELCMAVWGYYDEYAVDSLHNGIRRTRKIFGSGELGDHKKGAIRVKHGVGYYAVSSLIGANSGTYEKEVTVHEIADARIKVYPDELRVSIDNAMLEDLTKTEFNLLAALAQRPNKTISAWQLLQECHCRGAADITTPRRYVSSIRAKLGAELGDQRNGAIRTRRDIGYYAVSSLNGTSS